MIEQTIQELTAAVNRLAAATEGYVTLAERMKNTFERQIEVLTKQADATICLTDEPNPAPAPPKKQAKRKTEEPAPEVLPEPAGEIEETPVSDPAPEPTPSPEPAGTPVTHEDIRQLVRSFRENNPDKITQNRADLAAILEPLGIDNVSRCPDDKLAELFEAVKKICL